MLRKHHAPGRHRVRSRWRPFPGRPPQLRQRHRPAWRCSSRSAAPGRRRCHARSRQRRVPADPQRRRPLPRDRQGRRAVTGDQQRRRPLLRDPRLRASKPPTSPTGARTALRAALEGSPTTRTRTIFTVPTCDGSDLSACPATPRAGCSPPPPTQTVKPTLHPTQPTEPNPGSQVPEAGRNRLIQARLHVSIGRTPLLPSRSSGAATAAASSIPALPQARRQCSIRPRSAKTAGRGPRRNIALSAGAPQRQGTPASRCAAHRRPATG